MARPIAGAVRCLLFAVCASSLLAGCFARRDILGPGDEDWGVKVRWYGHSCFSFQDSTGRLFLIDPFDETVGYDLPALDANVILVTHDHFDHNHIRQAEPFDMMDSTGTHTLEGIEVTGAPSFHDKERGRRHGPNRFFVWNMGGLRLAHLGDLGEEDFAEEQLKILGSVDILFIPVGGKTTIDAAAAAGLVRAINPKVVVPMHYGNRLVRFFEFEPVDAFLKSFRNVVTPPEPGFQMSRALLPSETTVYIPALPESRR